MKVKKLLKTLAVFALIAALVIPFVNAASWKTGDFNNGTNYTKVLTLYPNVSKHRSLFSGTYYTAQTPSVTFYSYRGNGKEKTGTTMYVQVLQYQGSGKNWSCVYDYKVKDGQTITLNLRNRNKKYYDDSYLLSRYYLSGKDSAQADNVFKFRIRRYKSSTDVKWWAIKVNNGTAYN